MAASCSTSCLRGCVIAFNIVMLLLGLGVFGVGLWLLTDRYAMYWLSLLDLNSAAALGRVVSYICIASGAFLAIVCVIGATGAGQENIGCLRAYIVLAVLVMLAIVASAVIALINIVWVRDFLKEDMTEFLKNDYTEISNEYLSQAFDNMQKSFTCCGVDSKADWVDSNWYQNETDASQGWKWPRSCCVQNSTGIVDLDGCRTDQNDAVNSNGCYPPLSFWLRACNAALAGVLLLLLILKIALTGCAGTMHRHLISIKPHV